MKIEVLMIHHSGISYDKNPNQFEANNRYHKKWNFKSSLGFYLGYNYEISKDGITRQARRDGERTAACYQQGMNNGKAIHICLDGNFSIEYPTREQEIALTKLLKELQLKYPEAKIIHHRDIKTTSCPGNLLSKEWHKNLINNNKKGMIIKKENEPMLYVPVGNKLIQFKTDWPTYAKNFESETIIEINEKEFKKFEVVDNVTINKYFK